MHFDLLVGTAMNPCFALAPTLCQGSQKVQLLAQTLRSYWGAPGGGGGGSLGASGSGQWASELQPSPSPVRDPTRASWISSRQQELDDMQRAFMSSPHSVAAAAAANR